MKYKTSIARIALYVKALYLQKFSKVLIQYLIIALIFIASTSLSSLLTATNFPFIASPRLLIFLLSPTIFHLAILLYVSKSFEEFHERKTSSLLLTLPASSFEKYSGIFLFYFLSHVILGTIILFASQLLAGIFTEAILHNSHDTFNSWLNNTHSLGGRLQESEGILSHVISKIIALFHKLIERFGYFFLIALLFKKHQFIKAILIVWSLYSLQAMLTFIIRIVQFSKTQGDISQHYPTMPFQENIFMIGSIVCIIIGYFRFSKIQYS